MCEEHSVIAILRREEFPKFLNREKENWQFVFLPSFYLDQLSCALLLTEIWAAQARAHQIQAFGLAVKNTTRPSSQLVWIQESCECGPISVLWLLILFLELALASIGQSKGHHLKQGAVLHTIEVV